MFLATTQKKKRSPSSDAKNGPRPVLTQKKKGNPTVSENAILLGLMGGIESVLSEIRLFRKRAVEGGVIRRGLCH